MSRSILRLHKKWIVIISIAIGFIILIPLIALAAFNIYFAGKIFPGIFIASINVGGLTTSEANLLLSEKVSVPQAVKLNYQSQSFNLESKTVNLSYDFTKSVRLAYNLTRTDTIVADLYERVLLLVQPKNLSLSVNFDGNKMQKFISVVSGQISVTPTPPSISINRPSVTINKGTPGVEVDQATLLKTIVDNISFAKNEDIQIPAQEIGTTLTEKEAVDLKTRAEKFLGKSITLNFEFSSFNLSDSDILSFLGPRGGYDDTKLQSRVEKIASQINRDPQNPKFTFDNGKVTEFQPALDGVQVNSDQLIIDIANSLNQLEDGQNKNMGLDIPVVTAPPEVTTDQVNNLGIKELVGRGTSTFFHSIPSRVYNVVLAAGRINGTLVKPGDTFSFNDTLGDVSAFTGYQQAYIISGGKTILGDGGGVCQVSTTLFRAVLNAGLPITERAAHAYRVGYYEQNSPPGFDATVYGPSPDFKFRNDTPGYILIEAMADPKKYSLIFELYGTSDGRVSTTSKPVVSDVSAPPEDLYQDDPTLPAGTIKQVDFKAWGAKVTFNYKVVRGGETLINKTFISNYRPWQAIYLRGTGPAI